MENGWIKLHRKLLENDIMADGNAFRVFCWLLLKVDRDTGKKKVARSWGARELQMPEVTFYDALMRLVKKYKMATACPTPNYTIISLSNWAKYQSSEDMPDTLPDSNPTATRQQPDTLQEGRIENKEKNIHEDKPRALPKTYIQRIGVYYENECKTKITNWGKQGKAMSSMVKAGFTEEQICNCITYMATKHPFYQGKGFDLTTVSNEIVRLKAQER